MKMGASCGMVWSGRIRNESDGQTEKLMGYLEETSRLLSSYSKAILIPDSSRC